MPTAQRPTDTQAQHCVASGHVARGWAFEERAVRGPEAPLTSFHTRGTGCRRLGGQAGMGLSRKRGKLKARLGVVGRAWWEPTSGYRDIYQTGVLQAGAVPGGSRPAVAMEVSSLDGLRVPKHPSRHIFHPSVCNPGTFSTWPAPRLAPTGSSPPHGEQSKLPGRPQGPRHPLPQAGCTAPLCPLRLDTCLDVITWTASSSP